MGFSVMSTSVQGGLFASYELKLERKPGAIFAGYGILGIIILLLLTITFTAGPLTFTEEVFVGVVGGTTRASRYAAPAGAPSSSGASGEPICSCRGSLSSTYAHPGSPDSSRRPAGCNARASRAAARNVINQCADGDTHTDDSGKTSSCGSVWRSSAIGRHAEP